MINLNFNNIEELIFYDKNIQSILPAKYYSIFEQWRIAKRIPMLASVGKQAILDLLNTLSSKDIEIMESYFGENLIIERMNYSVSKNIQIPIKDSSEICKMLCEVNDFNYFSTWRDENTLYISFWR